MSFDVNTKGLPTLRDLSVNTKGKKVAKFKGDGDVTDVTVVVGDLYKEMHLNDQYLVEVRIRPAQTTIEDEPDDDQMTIEIDPKGLPEPTEVVVEDEECEDADEVDDVEDDVEDEEE